MCGIGVTFDTRGEGRGEAWARPIMRHRGPDGEDMLALHDGQLVLEHCRLAIIDPENPEADQPFSDPEGRYALVYNGEIFNFRELRADLERRGVAFRTNSDTEVVLQTFMLDGEQGLRRLRGMFAFVIWDRELDVLTAVRDQIGVKPLYWALADGVFIAASEMRTIMRHPRLRPRLDPAGVVEYLAFGYTSGQLTLIEGIRQLPAGHLLRIRGGKLELEEYWDVLPAEDPPDDASLQRELVDLLDESVCAALVSDVPVSLMLSGGLDSSTIAALAVRHVDSADLTAYSVSFGLPNDESAVAARLAGDLGMRHREILMTEGGLQGEFDEWLGGMDVPSANPTWIAVSHIARAVKEDGGKVLLGGDGADELFGGYSRWMRYLRFHDQVWRRTPRGVRRLAGVGARPFVGGLAGDIARRARDGGDLFVGSRPFHDDDLTPILGAAGRDAVAALPVEHALVDLRRRFDERCPGGDYLAWMCYSSVKGKLVEDFLARLDKMGMRHSVEGRVPLLDPKLARWAFRLRQGQKVPGFEQKALFRRSVTPLLPDYIIRRPKQGFCPPVASWAEALLAERLSARAISDGGSLLVEQQLLAPEGLARLREDDSTGASFALWTLGTLIAWCEQNL